MCGPQAARQVEFMVGKKPAGPNTDSLEEAVAILQHHDGVSSTLIPFRLLILYDGLDTAYCAKTPIYHGLCLPF